MDRYEVVRTLGGGYGIRDKTGDPDFPWPTRFNLTRKEAYDWAEKLNSKKFKLTWWTTKPVKVKLEKVL